MDRFVESFDGVNNEPLLADQTQSHLGIKRKPRTLTVIGGISVVVILIGFIVSNVISIRTLTRENQQLKERVVIEQEKTLRLAAEKDQLEGIDRIQRLARDKYGMEFQKIQTNPIILQNHE